jgi:hypothetical protein
MGERKGDSPERIAFPFPLILKLAVIPNGAQRNEESLLTKNKMIKKDGYKG